MKKGKRKSRGETTAVEIFNEPPKNQMVNSIRTITAESLISQAISQKTPVETLEKLLAMRTQLKQEKAKELFDEAMSNFQSECPIIKKTKAGAKVNNVVTYWYAPLESIVDQVKIFLKNNGFSYTLRTKPLETGIEVTCIVKHISGHAEESSVSMPLGKGTSLMSAPQVVASALTFAKRYAFCNAFGILTSDDDNNGAMTTIKGQTKKQEPIKPQKSEMQIAAEKELSILREDIWKLSRKITGGNDTPEQKTFLENVQKETSISKLQKIKFELTEKSKESA